MWPWAGRGGGAELCFSDSGAGVGVGGSVPGGCRGVAGSVLLENLFYSVESLFEYSNKHP